MSLLDAVVSGDVKAVDRLTQTLNKIPMDVIRYLYGPVIPEKSEEIAEMRSRLVEFLRIECAEVAFQHKNMDAIQFICQHQFSFIGKFALHYPDLLFEYLDRDHLFPQVFYDYVDGKWIATKSTVLKGMKTVLTPKLVEHIMNGYWSSNLRDFCHIRAKYIKKATEALVGGINDLDLPAEATHEIYINEIISCL